MSYYTALSISTCGVGFIPVAPGTFGALVGIAIYFVYDKFINRAGFLLLQKGFSYQQYSALLVFATSVLFASLCLVSFWASHRAVSIFNKKDPQKVVVDEVIGQLLAFAFVPWHISRWQIFAGFLFFRLFDIWKPYPVRQFEKLEGGLGICADDLVAGVYAGICLSLVYFFGFLT
ncbi:MAG: phosphatidylglycerophosphatase A [Pyrinomonadaceae bacterium]